MEVEEAAAAFEEIVRLVPPDDREKAFNLLAKLAYQLMHEAANMTITTMINYMEKRFQTKEII